MGPRGDWLSAEEFAEVAEITARAARKALARAADGHPWGGHLLKVREQSGRGGKNGKRREVSLSSLSEAIGDDLSERMTPLDLEAMDPRQLIDLATVAESPADRVKIIAAWRRQTGKSRETAYRMIRKVEAGGHVATLRKKPSNAGQPRVAVSRAFTKAWLADGRDLDDAFALHEQLEQLIAAMWCDRYANAGAGRIAKDAAKALRKWCGEVDFEPTGKASRQVFEVPRRLSEMSRGNAVVHRKNTDAAAHYNAGPYRQSDLNALKPMEVLMGDVHHIDVKTHREDGSAAWCIKMITWMDVGTRRVWVNLKTCKKGESVTKADVNDSLAALFIHPDWGSPDYLLVDNGKEYALRDGLLEPMRLAAEAGGRSPVIRSRAYNARGKGLIEGWFGRFERGYLSLMPGWGGGDRMRTPTANQGKEIEAFPGSPELAEAVILQAVGVYNREPQKPLHGLSPLEAHDERRDERPAVTWSIEAVAYALADRTVRTNQKCRVRIGNQFYDLHGAAMAADTVTVLHGPYIQGGVLIEYAGELVFAEHSPIFDPTEKAGARYTAQRTQEFNAVVRKLGKDLPAVDPLMDLIEHHQPTIDLLAAQKATVQRAISPKERKAQDQIATDAQRARNDEVAAILRRLPAPQRAKVA